MLGPGLCRAIVCSTKDTAGMNLFERFCERGFKITEKKWDGMAVYEKEGTLLVRTNEDSVFAENVAGLDADEIVFASRHSSSAKIPTLTVHAPGNFGKAELGGKDRELCPCNANTMQNIFLELQKNTPSGYSVSLEVTHHGPCVNVPCCFAELGSSEGQWKDEKAAGFLASCILRGLESEELCESAIGIGGPHYAPAFTKAEKHIAVGHICARYAQDSLNKEMVKQMIEKTHPHPAKILIDEKGIKSKTEFLKMLSGHRVELI